MFYKPEQLHIYYISPIKEDIDTLLEISIKCLDSTRAIRHNIITKFRKT